MTTNDNHPFRKATFGLFIGSFISFCNLYLFQPLLPLIADHYSVSATQVNWVLAAATFTLALSLVPWAIYSEKIGRRKVLFISLYASPAVGLLLLLLPNIVIRSRIPCLPGSLAVFINATSHKYHVR